MVALVIIAKPVLSPMSIQNCEIDFHTNNFCDREILMLYNMYFDKARAILYLVVVMTWSEKYSSLQTLPSTSLLQIIISCALKSDCSFVGHNEFRYTAIRSREMRI